MTMCLTPHVQELARLQETVETDGPRLSPGFQVAVDHQIQFLVDCRRQAWPVKIQLVLTRPDAFVDQKLKVYRAQGIEIKVEKGEHGEYILTF